MLLLVLLVHRWSEAIVLASDVTWLKPVAGDAYTSGAYITGQWFTNDAESIPSFRLCGYDGQGERGQDDGEGTATMGDVRCGSAVRLEVTEPADNGSHQITM